MKESESQIIQQPDIPQKAFIDVEKVLKDKGRRFYPYIPGFLIRYLKRIIHEEEMNDVLNKYHNLYDFDFLDRILNEFFGVEIEIKNPENLPRHDRVIVASNHPLGGLDGMALMHAIGKYRKDVNFIVNDILLELDNLKNLFVPVNKHGKTSQQNVRIIEELYENDELVVIFPAGLVSRKQGKDKIIDLEWKKSFITKAIRHKRDIIPVYIKGENSKFFYNLAKWRKKLNIKLNLEMLYLPDEMFKQANKKITITFGKPIPYNTFSNSRTHQKWAQWVKEKVYDMSYEHEI